VRPFYSHAVDAIERVHQRLTNANTLSCRYGREECGPAREYHSNLILSTFGSCIPQSRAFALHTLNSLSLPRSRPHADPLPQTPSTLAPFFSHTHTPAGPRSASPRAVLPFARSFSGYFQWQEHQFSVTFQEHHSCLRRARRCKILSP
jgi:hypothetical protein